MRRAFWHAVCLATGLRLMNSASSFENLMNQTPSIELFRSIMIGRDSVGDWFCVVRVEAMRNWWGYVGGAGLSMAW